MASISYPRAGYNSGAVTSLEYERLVQAQAADGLIGTPADTALVYTDGTGTRAVKIRSGRRALVRGSMYDSGSTDITMSSLAANSSGNPRIDLIVLRLSRADYTVTETAITGTPSANPVAPSPLADTGAAGSWDLPVAQVRVEDGATAITADKVTPVAWYLGDDGQTLCTSTTRPPHQAGRAIYETDTGRRLLSDGTAWRTVSEDTGWVNFSTASGWVSRTTRIRRVNGWVQLHCDVARAGTTLAADTASTIATLPDGFRPAVAFTATGLPVSSSGQVSRISIQTTGVVRVVTGPGFGATSWLDCWASWPVG